MSVSINNGTIKLGINDYGTLGNNGALVGVVHMPTGKDGLLVGNVGGPAVFTTIEGWGITFVDGVNTRVGRVRNSAGTQTLSQLLQDSFASTASTATSICHHTLSTQVSIKHEFFPSLDARIYQCRVTVTNSGANPVSSVVYRRITNWNPDYAYNFDFNEFMTIIGRTGPFQTLYQDDGAFVQPDPSVPSSAATAEFPGSIDTDVTHLGPPLVSNHGVDMWFQLGALLGGKTLVFNLFFGAGSTEADGLAGLAAAGVDTTHGPYSIALANTP